MAAARKSSGSGRHRSTGSNGRKVTGTAAVGTVRMGPNGVRNRWNGKDWVPVRKSK